MERYVQPEIRIINFSAEEIMNNSYYGYNNILDYEVLFEPDSGWKTK
ncbi:MAG: hypothetical protein IJ736_15605 [Firmicutes bacterium]|nr:hypothetical protein [Bacillota bacterium]